MPGARGSITSLLEAGDTGLLSLLERTLLFIHLNLENRSVDGRVKKFSSQAVGMARNRVFLQPR